jgi:hypothetical protein
LAAAAAAAAAQLQVMQQAREWPEIRQFLLASIWAKAGLERLREHLESADKVQIFKIFTAAAMAAQHQRAVTAEPQVSFMLADPADLLLAAVKAAQAAAAELHHFLRAALEVALKAETERLAHWAQAAAAARAALAVQVLAAAAVQAVALQSWLCLWLLDKAFLYQLERAELAAVQLETLRQEPADVAAMGPFLFITKKREPNETITGKLL